MFLRNMKLKSKELVVFGNWELGLEWEVHLLVLS